MMSDLPPCGRCMLKVPGLGWTGKSSFCAAAHPEVVGGSARTPLGAGEVGFSAGQPFPE